jgi:hypothetical protein
VRKYVKCLASITTEWLGCKQSVFACVCVCLPHLVGTSSNSSSALPSRPRACSRCLLPQSVASLTMKTIRLRRFSADRVAVPVFEHTCSCDGVVDPQ